MSNITLKGASGADYRFTVHRWGTLSTSFGGVYIVLKETSLNRFVVLYVGIAENFNRRFANHHKSTCFNRRGKTHIGFLHRECEETRVDIEKDLLENRSPICNW